MVRRIALLVLLFTAGGSCAVTHADSLRLVVPQQAQPVVGEMIPVTLRGEYTSLIALESVTFPNAPAYDWVQLARDQWRDEEIGGRKIRVFERRLALFPRQAGPLVIGPVTHHLTVVGPDNRRDPLEVTAPPVQLAVAPFPAGSMPIAAADLTIEDALSTPPGSLRDGETLTRRVTLRAVGTLPHLLPPRPVLREPWLISFVAPEQRQMQTTPDGPVTTVIWEWRLRPKTGEPGVLPATSIPWFDTVARRMRTAEIPALPFGYASFHDNRSGAARLPAAQTGVALAVIAAGIVVGLGGALAGLSPRRKADLLRQLRRLSPLDPTKRAVKRAAITGDRLALRRAAERYLRRRRDLGLPTTGRETAQLDAELYARPDAAKEGAAMSAEALFRHVRDS